MSRCSWFPGPTHGPSRNDSLAIVAREEPEVTVERGVDRKEFSAGCQRARGVALGGEKGEGGLDPVTRARQMLLRQLNQHGRPIAPQGVLGAAQHGEFPALDVS